MKFGMGVCQVFLHSIFNKVLRYNLHIIEFIKLLQIYGYSFDIIFLVHLQYLLKQIDVFLNKNVAEEW